MGAPVCPFFFLRNWLPGYTWLLCCCPCSCVVREAVGGGGRLESSFGRRDIVEFSPSHFSYQECIKGWLAWPLCLDFRSKI